MEYYKPKNSYVKTVLIFTLMVALSWMKPVENARILAVAPIAGKSHWNVMSSIIRVLSNNGHHVTVFTPFPEGNRENYTEVDTSKITPNYMEQDVIDIINIWGTSTLIFQYVRSIGRQRCDTVYNNPQLKKIMEKYKKSDFDAVIIETIGHNCVSYLGTKLDLPMIYLITSPMMTFTEHTILGDIPNPATVSHLYAHHAVPKSFMERLTNTAFFTYSMLTLRYDDWVNQRNNPQPYDLMTNPVRPSLIFLNSHFISEASRPFPPNVVQVGGVHLKPSNSIPNDILEFIENSPHGVILFTFGSTVNVSTSPEYIFNVFKEALSQVPQRILWKYEIEMQNIPNNVMIRKWFPQRDILMHPNVKLFISHGGMSGIYETVDAGVPVLGFPLFYDQHKNIANLVDNGMAISMDLMTVKKDTILKNILELVNNEKYKKNAKIASDRFKDRPMSPEKSILYWTDYVIRHKSAPHLKSHALNLMWYEYLLLDVIAVMMIFVLIILLLVYKFVKIIYKCIVIEVRSVKTKNE